MLLVVFFKMPCVHKTAFIFFKFSQYFQFCELKVYESKFSHSLVSYALPRQSVCSSCYQRAVLGVGFQLVSLFLASKKVPLSRPRYSVGGAYCSNKKNITTEYLLHTFGVFRGMGFYTSSHIFTTLHKFSQHNFGHIFVKNCEEL